MTDVKISELPAASAPAGSEVAAVVQGGTTKRMIVGPSTAQLVDATLPLATSDLLSVSQGGVEKKVTTSQLGNAIGVSPSLILGDMPWITWRSCAGIVGSIGAMFTQDLSPANIGTPAGVGPNPATNLIQSFKPVRYTSATGTDTNCGQVASAGSNADCVFRACSGSAIAGGMRFQALFGFASIKASMRIYIGMNAGASQPFGDPSALLNWMGLAKDQNDTNMFMMVNDGSGTATKTDTGIAPVIEQLYQFTLSCPRSGSPVTMTLTNIDTGATFTTTFSTNLPVADQFLTPCVLLNTGNANSTAVQIYVVRYSLHWKPLFFDF